MKRFNQWLYAALLVAILFTGVTPRSAQAEVLECRELFGSYAPATIPGFEVPSEIGDIPRLEEKCGKGGPVRACTVQYLSYLEYYNPDGRLLAQIEYSLLKDGETLWINKYGVKPEARKKGISTWLLKEILNQNPQIKKVSGQLAATNYKAVLDEYYAITTPGSGRYIANLTRYKANILAVNASPFAKALMSLGFSKPLRADLSWVLIDGPPSVSLIMATYGKDPARTTDTP